MESWLACFRKRPPVFVYKYVGMRASGGLYYSNQQLALRDSVCGRTNCSDASFAWHSACTRHPDSKARNCIVGHHFRFTPTRHVECHTSLHCALSLAVTGQRSNLRRWAAFVPAPAGSVRTCADGQRSNLRQRASFVPAPTGSVRTCADGQRSNLRQRAAFECPWAAFEPALARARAAFEPAPACNIQI